MILGMNLLESVAKKRDELKDEFRRQLISIASLVADGIHRNQLISDEFSVIMSEGMPILCLETKTKEGTSRIPVHKWNDEIFHKFKLLIDQKFLNCIISTVEELSLVDANLIKNIQNEFNDNPKRKEKEQSTNSLKTPSPGVCMRCKTLFSSEKIVEIYKTNKKIVCPNCLDKGNVVPQNIIRAAVNSLIEPKRK